LLVIEGPKKTAAFILHPKTGTQSIYHALKSQGKLIKRHHGIDLDMLDGIVADGGIVAGTVRYPLDAIISWFHYTNPGNAAFAGWLKRYLVGSEGGPYHEVGMNPRLKIGRMFYGAEWMNRTIRFEDGIERQLNEILEEIGHDPVEIEHRNASKERRPWEEYFSDDMIRSVETQFPLDFIEFSYPLKNSSDLLY